jgi:hypothetical protein
LPAGYIGTKKQCNIVVLQRPFVSYRDASRACRYLQAYEIHKNEIYAVDLFLSFDLRIN